MYIGTFANSEDKLPCSKTFDTSQTSNDMDRKKIDCAIRHTCFRENEGLIESIPTSHSATIDCNDLLYSS